MNTPLEAAPLQRVRVVLVRTSHAGNIGAAARAMKTMGLARLCLVSPRHFPDPQAAAMACGADDVLAAAVVCDDMSSALAGTVFAVGLTARRRELATPFAWVREAAAELAAMACHGEVALVFGNETSGLSNEEAGHCQRLAMIPADPGYSSLNLAAAVQILCYELRLATLDPGAPPAIAGAGEAAAHEDVDRLIGHMERVATASGFLDTAQPRRLMARLRRLYARARLEREEVSILRGLLTAVEKKLDPPRG